MLATWVTQQVVFDGAINGLVFALLAFGIILIYRSSRVINFAAGNMGLIGTALVGLLVVRYGVPFWLAVVIGLALGTAFGAVVELVVVRRLFSASRVILLVATIGVAELSLAIITAYPQLEVNGPRFPTAIGGFRDVGDLRIAGPQLMILIVVPVLVVGLTWFLNRTAFGKAVKASADNPDLARTFGVNPKTVSTVVWAVAGLVATVSMLLVAGKAGAPTGLATLGPNTLVRALAAAVVAGMVSFKRAAIAGLVIGVLQSLIQFNYLDSAGLVDFLLLIVVLVSVWFQSRQPAGAETSPFSFTPRVPPIPERVRSIWWIRHLNKLALGVLGLVAVVLPLVVTQPSRHLLYTTVLAFAICAMSVTVLTGWAGQLSLGQMAFAGLGALTAAALTRGLAATIGFAGIDLVAVDLYGIPFVLAVLVASLAMAALAAIVGIGALRVRGLLLAISTFAFALAAQQYLYQRPIFQGTTFSTSVPFPRGALLGIDLNEQRNYYYVVLAITVVVLLSLLHLRRSGVGRRTVGVRDNQDTAAAYTVRPALTKLQAFALAGGLAGLGGALLAGAVERVPSTERFFLVEDSLRLVGMAVIGGLGSVTGAVIGAVWVVGLPTLFPDSAIAPLLTSSLGLLVLLLYVPGGFMEVAYGARAALVRWADKRLGPEPARAEVIIPASVKPAIRRDRPTEGVVLQASGITVTFGGIVAVNGVDLRVDAGEVVGLIGTNGAGKSTFMNALGGFVPSQGSVELLGEDITSASPAQRAAAGLGRTFQAARLFPELTVRETVQVALEARHRTGFVSTALWLPPALRSERAKRSDAADLVDFLGLGRYADHYIADLSTGTRRIVELACLLALDASVLCLDEPTAGVAQKETEAFGPLLVELRRELGASILLIEHDMPLVMSVSDRIYCLEAGAVIGEGPPDDVRSSPRVIASYLGTDERAIARSGQAT